MRATYLVRGTFLIKITPLWANKLGELRFPALDLAMLATISLLLLLCVGLGIGLVLVCGMLESAQSLRRLFSLRDIRRAARQLLRFRLGGCLWMVLVFQVVLAVIIRQYGIHASLPTLLAVTAGITFVGWLTTACITDAAGCGRVRRRRGDYR